MSAEVQATWLQDFYLKYVTASGHWCDAGGCLITPTYNHLWFVAYLLGYTLVLVAVRPLLRRGPVRWSGVIEGPGLILVPWAVMFLLRATLAPHFGETRAIWNDGYLHPLYFATFLFGHAIAHRDRFFDRCERLRWVCLVMALTAWGLLEINLRVRGVVPRPPLDPVRLLGTALHELQAWTAIVGVIGFAHRHLRTVDKPARRVLTQAVFPFYLVHQTIIVVVGHHLDAWQLPVALEATVLIACTGAGCWVFFEVGRRVPVLRPWIGLPPRRDVVGAAYADAAR